MDKRDEATLNTIRQLIKEVKEEMKTKKVLSEGKTPQKVFESQEKSMKKYIAENILKVIEDAEK